MSALGKTLGALRHVTLSDWIQYTPSIAALIIIVYVCAHVCYNLFFHPLASFPGPLLARSTLLWRIWHSLKGRFHIAIDNQHQRYGPVVRVSPNELSFASATSFKAIYGHPAPGKPTLIKSKFYEMYGSGFNSLCVGSERDPKNHNRMKKSLSGAFSTRALSEQEDIIQKCINAFIDKIGRDGGRESQGLNVTKWYEMVAFDILGEMAFGESFHCIEQGKPHFWSELVLNHLFFITLMDNLRRYSLIVTIAKYLLPRWTVGVRDKHTGFSREKVSQRLTNKSSRKDFLTTIIDKVESGEVSKEELTAHSSTLIIAGGETVSTFLAATTFYLLTTPEPYRKLQEEIRSRFKSIDDIDATSAQQLPYLQAVISEGLRIYPPGSQGFPRISPGVMVDGIWVPEGSEIYTSAWSVTHDPKYFHEPMQFIPERWLDPECTDVKEASQPFSLGPRICLGRNFAYVEMSLILAKTLFKYDLELVNNPGSTSSTGSDSDSKGSDSGSVVDWEGASRMHIMWWKPELRVRFLER